MRRWMALTAALALLVAMGAAQARPSKKADGPSPGGISSDNVEWLSHIPLIPSATGGRVVGDYFYVNDQNKITIMDISDPLNPAITGVLPMPQEAIFSREDLDTNGKIMVVPDTVRGVLHVVDVEDKTNPTIIAELPGGAAHTVSCILDCKWAYGSEGSIIDLRDPTNPEMMEEQWGDGMPTTSGHDVNEVKIGSGIVLTSTQPMMLLDARKDPRHPKLLATGSNEDFRFIHSSTWPQGGKDKILLAGGETNFKPRCNETNGAFMTWDASDWKKTHTFTMIDEYRMINGTYTDGNPAVNGVGCSSHWLEASPKFKNGGIVAAAFFEHGTRFIDISSKGKIEEIGYFMPHAGSTGAVYWITKDILYAVDYSRGIDILRFTGKQ
ncbi:MAG TPA: hypothetical protein VNC78_12535 [Actinomycetota bacterium]|nr:hypothetical protein [Actinomycetota bacterium]